MNLEAPRLAPSDEEIRGLIERLYCTRFFRTRPKLTSMLLTTLQHALMKTPPHLKLLFLWGVHGKNRIDADDHQAMDFLAAFIKYVSLCFSANSEMTVIACDTHGAVNRVDPMDAEDYAREVETAAIARGWNTLRMSSLWRLTGISLDQVDASAKTVDIQGKAPRLVQFARRYYSGPDAEEGARRYLAARLLERPMLSEWFRGWIHVTPVEPSLHCLQPDLPEFYIWTRKRGCSVKPWFPTERP